MSPDTATTQERQLDAGGTPTRFARGWHCLGPAAEFRDGKPHEVRAFGGKLVVWADTAGQLKAV